MWIPFSEFFCFFLGCVLVMGSLLSKTVYAFGEGLPVFREERVSNTLKEYDLYATAAVLMDGDTGRVLFGKNEEEHLANASTTKILTCIVVLENCDADEYLQVSSDAARQPDVQADLNTGEYYRVRDLLYSIMLESHNDSAYALAEHVGGSIEGFANMMNETAEKIGCENSYFITPNGLDAYDEKKGIGHGSSAVDLARIMKYCIFESEKAKDFLEITQTDSYLFSNYVYRESTKTYENGNRVVSCVNHNALLHVLPGMLSGKTGFTNQAGYCYVGALTSEGRNYIIALLGCGWPPNKTYKWADAKKLFAYGMQEYELREIEFGKESLPNPEVPGGIPKENSFEEKTYLSLTCERYSRQVLLRRDETITVRISCPTVIKRAIAESEEVGEISYLIDDFVLQRETIKAGNTVLQKTNRWAVLVYWEMFLEEFKLR